jgi:hypothetical protein
MNLPPFPRRCQHAAFSFLALLGLLAPSTARAQIKFGLEPINYESAESNDPVAQLQKRIDAGEVSLKYDPEKGGYLADLLKYLDVPASSQVLVFSKTSFQLRRINPERPRALYFNDDTYLGWVQNGDVIEIMSTDPDLGEVFYTLTLDPTEKPELVRDRGHCITCHASSRTQGVPGVLVRSAYVDSSGQPQFGSGTFTTDHTTPFEQRYGGWYVTGTHGDMRHMGNVFSPGRRNAENLDRESGANVTDLSSRLDLSPYLTPHSDLVAMMVLEHQSQMHNFLTLANYETRSALHYDMIMNEALDRGDGHVSDTTNRRVASAGDKLLEYMLFVGEFPLQSPVAGTSTFAEEFQARGPKDGKGRSLRDLDLQTRLLKHPCSFLIYSPSFDGLPGMVKTYVTTRLHRVLTGEDDSEKFAHLSADDRKAILEILTETKPGIWDCVKR